MLLTGALAGCSGDDHPSNNGSGGGGAGQSGSTTGGSAGQTPSGGSPSMAGTSISDAAGGPTTPPGLEPKAMPLISGDAPAFASSTEANGKPDAAKDRKPDTRWSSTSLPAWLAYDLSGVPEEQRQQVLIAWYGGLAADFINTTPDPGKRLPIDYTLEKNKAKGGGDPPADGWEVMATVTGNDRNSRQRLVDLAGANWVRINVTKGASPDSVAIDMDVHSAPDGATDSWLLMGDSITFLSTTYLFSNLPELVNERDSTRFPAIIPAGIGGTNTKTAMDAIDNTIADYPGRYVGLSYGTNDHADDYHMEELVQKVIAAGKTPVVPHMPWSSTATTQDVGPKINKIIDDLYAKYPEILPGPDLWKVFTDHTDWIPEGDVHPNGDGQLQLRKAWAAVMAP
jgi:hypothetical protein